MPREAFYENANKGKIIVAVNTDGELAGYLFFRTNQRRRALIIVHLCVASKYRGKDVSNNLIDTLINQYGN